MTGKEEQIKRLLRQVRKGSVPVTEALDYLRDLPFKDVGFARIDSHRELRKGFPEAVYCEGKTVEQIERIAGEIRASGGVLLLTRVRPDVYERLRKKYPGIKYNRDARIIYQGRKRARKAGGEIMVISAGTSDIPVAEEAALTADLLGNRVRRLYDVGVAGVHRLLAEMPKIRRAKVVIVIAGMDGVLPSFVAGIVSQPVIAVPTSIGYGASFSGLAPLLTMLNCCAPGVAVVNIDNGFGAGCLASMINK